MPSPARPARFVAGRTLFLTAALWAGPLGAEQDDDPIRRTVATLDEKEIYEREMIQRALDRFGLEPDPQPGTKRIERVEIVRFPIVEASDPWPSFVNLFHVTTREHIVRQELLFQTGQAYDDEKMRESARNLRRLPLLFSTVRIVTAKGRRPDGVVVVVITKDLWSIRLNSNGNFGGGALNFFYITPSEQNFLGYNQQIGLHYYIDRDVHAFGQIYRVPRLLGARLRLVENLAIRINHHTQEVEGGFGFIRISHHTQEVKGGFGSIPLRRPLFSVDAKWGFDVQAAFDIGISRPVAGHGHRRVDIPHGDAVYTVPEFSKHRSFNFQAMVQRSFGKRHKIDLSFGYKLHSHTYALADELESLPDPVRRAFVRHWLPVDDQAGSLHAGASFYEARYARLQNVQTFGLTEDFHLGPSALFELSWSNPAFGFAQRSLKLSGALGYRLDWGGNLLAVLCRASVRHMPDHGLVDAGTDWIDRSLNIYLENVSPELFAVGRLLVRLKYIYTQYSRARNQFTLGGENTLRGFVAGFAAGQRLFNANVELRSRPLVIYTVHFGFVLFYDGGDAFDFGPGDDFDYHQSIGLGLRFLVPQFDRGVVRIDFGVPLGDDFNSNVFDWVTIAFLQAF